MQLKHSLQKLIVRYKILFVSCAVGFVCSTLFFGLFRYSHILIRGAQQFDNAPIVSSVSNRPVFLFPAAELEKGILHDFPVLRFARADIELPNTVTITVTYKPVYAWVRTDMGFVLVAEDGTVMEKTRDKKPDMTVITNNFPIRHTEYQRGQRISYSVLQTALQAIHILTSEGLPVEAVAIDSVDMVACKTESIDVLFSQSRSMDLQKHEIRQILKRLRLGDLKIESVDLRFDKPVIKTKS